LKEFLPPLPKGGGSRRLTEGFEHIKPMAGDGTQEDHAYTLKITWDSSLDSEEYQGKSYTCALHKITKLKF